MWQVVAQIVTFCVTPELLLLFIYFFWLEVPLVCESPARVKI